MKFRQLPLFAKAFLILFCAIGMLIILKVILNWHSQSSINLIILSICIVSILFVIFYSYKIRLNTLRGEVEYLQQQCELYLSTTRSLAASIAAKDRYTQRHISRVECYALAIAEALNLNEDELNGLKTAALLYDVGKLGVPEHILTKNGELTQEDRLRINLHPVIGSEMLASIEFPWPVIPIVRHHHERYDGTGYPDGLKGEKIPLGSRILALADTYDAIISDRSYRPRKSPDEAITIIKKEAGKQFDPKLVEIFVDLLEKHGKEIERQIEERIETEDISSLLPKTERATALSQSDEKVFNEIARAHREAYALYEISQCLNRSLGASETIDLILSKIGNIIDYSGCAIFLVDSERGELYSRGTAGPLSELLNDLRIRIGNGITGKAADRHLALISDNPEDDLDAKINRESNGCPFKSVIAIPLEIDDTLIGYISAYHTVPKAFSDDHLRLMSVVAPQAARAIMNALEFEKTREYAFTDDLTGLGNRRLLTTCLEQEMEKAKAQNRSVSLVAIDIDGLKSINDTYGHDVGDEVLVHVANQIRSAVRTSDFVARLGGDEFFAVIPNIGRKALNELEKRLENARALKGFVTSTGHKIDIVLSVGYATYPDDAETSTALFRAADQSMYQNKRHRKKALAQ